MSIVVLGMEMPTNCALCDCSFGALCYVSPAEVNGYCPGHGRPEWCPLVELPEKHGKLIDANALVGRFEPKQAYFTEAIINKLGTAPVIVEAEGE